MIAAAAAVDFADERKDLLETAFSRILEQFRGSPVFLQFLAVFIKETQELHDALVDLQERRTIGAADGVNLDALGRIVGKPRAAYQYSEDNWLFADRGGQGSDQIDAWCLGAEMATYAPAGDNSYRMMVFAKVVANHARFGSIPELQDLILLVTGENVSFERAAPMGVRMLVSAGISLTNLNFLLSFATTMQVDDGPFLPYPATLSIDDVTIFLPSTFFCADRSAQGCDFAPVAVGSARSLYANA